MLNKLTSKISRFFDGVLTAGEVGAGFLLVFITLAITCDITLRYLINKPLLWVVEVSTFSLVAITFFGAAWLLKKEGHVSMDQLYNRQTSKTQAVLQIVTSVLSTAACLVVVWYGWQVTVDYYLNGDRYYTMLEAPKWPISGLVVLGFVLLFFQFIRRIGKNIAVFRGSETANAKKWQ